MTTSTTMIHLPARAAHMLGLALTSDRHPLARYFGVVKPGSTHLCRLHGDEANQLYRYASRLAEGDYWGHPAYTGLENKDVQRALRLAEKKLAEQLYVDRFQAQAATRLYDRSNPFYAYAKNSRAILGEADVDRLLTTLRQDRNG